MKKWKMSVMAVLAIVFAAGAQVVVAEDAATAEKETVKAKSSKCAISEKLNLTEDQVKKLASLQTDCDAAGCKISAAKKYQAGLKTILTPKQLALFEEECAANGGCKITAASKLKASLAAKAEASE